MPLRAVLFKQSEIAAASDGLTELGNYANIIYIFSYKRDEKPRMSEDRIIGPDREENGRPGAALSDESKPREPEKVPEAESASLLPEKGNPHAGHREKLKRRFMQGDFDRFEDHTALELLLFYALPQRDTNPLAHRLIDRFGSLSAVLDAPADELCQVDGVSFHTATLIKLIPALCRRYRMSQAIPKNAALDSVGKLGRFAVSLYTGITRETVFLILLDNRFHLLDTVMLYEGSVNSVQVSSRRIIEAAMSRRAAMVALAHNHPGGLPIPSSEDLATNEVISSALALMDIRYVEHFVIAGEQYGTVMLRDRVVKNDTFWRPFYERD